MRNDKVEKLLGSWIIVCGVVYVKQNCAINYVVKCTMRRKINYKRQTNCREARTEAQKILPNIFERASMNQKYCRQQNVTANRQTVSSAQEYTHAESQPVNYSKWDSMDIEKRNRVARFANSLRHLERCL